MKLLFRFRIVLTLTFALMCAEQSLGDDPSAQISHYLRSGAFAAARELASQVPVTNGQRDEAFAQVARAQMRSGELAASSDTLREIESSQYRELATEASSTDNPSGGGSFADFDSLMQLIQTTVAPDTWEALGGPSTMAPYAQGILVDPNGLVSEVNTVNGRDLGIDVAQILDSNPVTDSLNTTPQPNQWRLPSPQRVVSLRRLRDETARRELIGLPLAESMYYLAGISEIHHLVMLPDDVLIVSPVGGIQSRQGWLVDARTGRHPLRLDFLAAASGSALANRPFGCTIDPTHDGLLRAQQFAADVQSDAIPIGVAADQLAAALGKQSVEVFGTPANTTLGMLMVEADRHMKRLALGDAEMPDGVSNYLNFVDKMIERGPPADVLIRLWFTAHPQTIQSDAAGQVFAISGQPLRLSGQNEREAQAGRQRVADDPRTIAFITEFNDHFEAIRSMYPVYGAMESLYRAAGVAQVVNRFSKDDANRELLASIARLESFDHQLRPTPEFVNSIAVLHNVRSGRKIHHILLASGGVLVDLQHTVSARTQTYPTLAAVVGRVQEQPIAIGRWWWDAAP